MRSDAPVPTGLVSEIQRFSVHDGTGIRTVVFLKGCPLRCLWCHNPEARLQEVLIMQSNELCIRCGACIAACPIRCLHMGENGPVTDRQACTRCGKCTELCFSGARKRIGKRYTVAEIMPVLLRDRVFYRNSGGGVTLSGGDPVANVPFACALLAALHEEGVHTAIETCGLCEEDRFRALLQHTDLVLYDIKHTDSAQHRAYTGRDNAQILQNLFLPSQMGKELIVRVPLIPKVNDGAENLEKTARLALDAGAKEVHILPFHQLGENKWENLDLDYALRGMDEMSDESAERAAEIVRSAGISACVGGSGS